ASPVVVAVGQIVVQMDVEIGRAAARVQIEHATRAARARIETDAARFGGEREGVPWGEDVDSLVRTLWPRRAEVVREVDGAEHREDDPRPRGRWRLGLRLRMGRRVDRGRGSR